MAHDEGTEPVGDAPPLRALARWFASAIGAALLLVGAALVAPYVPVAPLFAFVIGFAAVATSMVTTALAAPLLPRSALAGVLLAIAALVLVYALDLARGSSITGAAVITCALLLGASCVGAVVARGVEDPGHLLVVAVVFTLVDTASVFHKAGPTAAIVENETLLSLVALPWPQLGARTLTIEPFLGMGDIIATALFVGVAKKHGLDVGRTAAALFGALALTMAIVLLTEIPIPVLPFMAFSVLLVHPRARRLRKQDRKPALIGLLALMLVYAAIWRFGQ
jgi:hypothetical protein